MVGKYEDESGKSLYVSLVSAPVSQGTYIPKFYQGYSGKLVMIDHAKFYIHLHMRTSASYHAPLYDISIPPCKTYHSSLLVVAMG